MNEQNDRRTSSLSEDGHPMMSDDNLREGLVVRSQSGFYTVRVGEQTLVCSLPGRFKQGRRTEKSPLVIGDHVLVRQANDQEGAIERIQPRRNELARAAAGGVDLKHVLAANLDLVILGFALHEPDLNTPRLDRFLLAAEQAEIPPVIVITKLDLGSVEEAERMLRPYRDIGYPVVLTSVRSGEGLTAIRDILAGKISTIIGSSGVGKSSLLNALQPGLGLRFAEISAATGKGRHTTTVADLLPLDFGGYLADTPGLRELAPWDLDPEEVPLLFPEMRPYLDACRFTHCTHVHEPGCAVRRALEEGLIDPSRYRSYVRIRAESIHDAEPPGRRGG
ncbi:MAG TPA: ribosome small subunit-dependent GTPase A [Chloroflexota bacterium]|nr:ribosome small subunit-dependent GTPase A [Chloroflexota bacterium]